VNSDIISLFSDSDVPNLFEAGIYDGVPTDYEYSVTTKFVENQDFSDDVVMMRVA
jgi:hypothetical protein